MISTKTYKDEAINHLDNQQKRWFAIRTKYKCEKFVTGLLAKKQIVSYVPLQTVIKRYNSKVKKYEIPLINNYVFVHIVSKDYIPTLETEYVFQFIKQGNNLISIPEEEITILKMIVGDVKDVNLVHSEKLSVGEDVEVVAGRLAGLTGKIVSKLGKKRFVIELKNIGFQFQVQIDMALLRPTNYISAVV